MKKLMLLFIVASVVLTFSCNRKKDTGENYPNQNMDLIAPAGAGGGWDTTIRAVAQTLKETGLVDVNLPVRNVPGAGGSKALTELQRKKESDNTLIVYSSPLLLTKLAGTTPLNHKDTTPIANLIADYAVFVTSPDSPYQNMNDLMNAIKADPRSVKVGGTSSAGSMDHIQFLLMARAFGITDLKDIPYISFDDGSGTAQVLGGHIDLYSTGLAETIPLLESGNLRALGQTADSTKAGIPSMKDQGINATFVNWRGIFGPPDMPEYALSYWSKILADMITMPEWDVQKEKYGWDDFYISTEDYPIFLDQMNSDFEAILTEIGML